MKILLADDHTLFRDALVQYIKTAEPQTTISVAKDLNETLGVISHESDYDLILLDYLMPGMEGVSGIKKVKIKCPSARLAIMSGVAAPCDIDLAFKNGIAGYFPKTLSGKDLLSGIKEVVSGKIYVPKPDDTNTFSLPSFSDNKRNDKKGAIQHRNQELKVGLTPREKEVLSYLVKGASNKEIAHALLVEVVTIKLHVRGIFGKLNVKNRTQAALVAKDMGIVSAS